MLSIRSVLNLGLHKTKLPIIFFTAILMLTATVAVSAFSSPVAAQVTGSFTVNNGADYTNSTAVTLNITAVNATQMRFSNDNSTWSNLETYATAKNWTLPTTDANYTVYAQFVDDANNTSTAIDAIFLDTTLPSPYPYIDYYSSDLKTWYFDASGSSDNVGIASYIWKFGDGNTTSGVAMIHTYVPGNYTVSLSVIDFAGNNATMSYNIRVPDLSALPSATPTAHPTANPTVNPTIHPTATATPPPESTPTGFDSTWAIIIVAVIVIVVGSLAIVLLLMKRSKPAPPAPSAF
jgi:hypothetical protein